MRGEWIEIPGRGARADSPWSLPMRGEWIEMLSAMDYNAHWSLPMRGEWIEIGHNINPITFNDVSPHAGRVD